MNDKTKILYDQLTKDGYDIGDYNSFSNNVKDDNKRKTLYNTITNDGYDVGDYDTFSAKLVGNGQPTGVDNVTTTPKRANANETFVQNPKVRERILANTPDYFKSKGNNLSTLPLGTNIQDANDIAQEEQQRVALAERAANDPYMRQQELEHVFKPKNQEQINSVNKMIADARRKRAEERRKNARAVKSDGLFSTLSQAYVAGEQNDTDKQLEYASSLMEEAQNITNEAKKKGNTNFFSGFARGFKDAPLDGWAMGLQDLKNYSAAKKVLDKVDKGEQLNPAEDALMQALVTNAATKMYYSGDLGRGYKAGGVTAESLPFMLDMIAGMGTIQAVTKPASKAIVKYATEKAAKYGLGKATTGLAKGAARTIAGLGDVAAHTATFGSARAAADYQRRGMGDIQVAPNTDGTVSYAGRNNVQTGAEAIAKSVISTAAETGTELLGEYFAPMLGWVGKVTGANKIGKIIPASVGKAYSNIVNSQGFKNIQELAQRAKIADPIGEYGEEVVNNLISTAIGDMTPEELVDLDQNIDTFLGVAPMSVLFGAAGTGGYLREKYKNYRDMRTFENEMQETMGEDWSGVKEALQDADIETARDMVKDVLSSDMQPDMKKKAINYISSVLQEQTLQEVDKQQMPEQIAQAKQGIIANMQRYKDTLIKKGMSENEISTALNDTFNLSPEEMEGKYGVDRANDIYNYRHAYTDYADYNYWVQNKAYDARKEAESQVEKMTNATTGTVMRVNSGLSKNPVNVLRGNIVFDNDGNVDQNQSDNTIYYLADDGKVKMAPISMFQSLVDDTPAEGLAQQAGQDAEEEVLQGEEAQINSTPEGQQQQIEVGTRFNQGGNNYEVMSKTADGYVVAALDADGNPMQSQQVSEGDLINAINSQNQAQPEQPVAQPDMNAQPQEGQTVQTEQPATQQTPDQPATAMSRIPLNEKGEQDFEKAPVEDTSAALIEISDSIDDAKDTAQQMIDNYNNELKKADKAKTTGNSIQEIVRLKQEKKANIQAINDKIAYWNKVASQIESQRPGGIIAQAEEEAKANQQRLDNMTQEQQQAAQQEVQKKIESGAYEKKQPRKRVRYVKEDSDMGESVTPLEHVLREIATGRVTFNWNDSGTTQGLGSHLGLASSPEERKKLIWALSSDGMTPEAAAEQIHADMPENLQGIVTDQDIFNMILNSFQEYGSPSKMWEEAKRMHGTDIEESIPGYDEDMERMQLEWEAENNGMTVPEWIDYCDYIEEELNNRYSSVSDEELNTIFEQIYNDYEQRRTETESAGSTEGQPDGKQGDEVLPASESDNAGTGAEVEEQPKPADQADGESGSVVPEPEGKVKTDIEKAREDVDQNPTEAQKEAGNYKKGHVKIDGYDVTIENPKGSVRSGKDANGKEWSVTMNNDYGYIRGTEGVDGDHIDVFLSDNPESGDVFVIDQVNPDGSFDEHKVMYGFKFALAAKRAYLANYSKGWTGLGNITRVSKEEFKKWIDSSNRKTKPFAEYKSVKPVDNNKVTSVEEFMKNAESDYFRVERPSEEDLPELKKIANSVLQKGKNKSDITTEEGYNEMSATFEGIYPKEKALLDKYRDNGGAAWVDYDDKCVYRINYDPAKYKGKSDKVTVIKEYFKTPSQDNYLTEASRNRIVSSARYEELKKRMREKLNQLNAGIDPEIIAIGAEMAVYHIERGAIKFADYASAMIKDMGDMIRPYLKAFYSSARYMPQAIESGLPDKMTPDSEVSKFDVTNFDKKSIDVLEQIKNVAKEQEVEKSQKSNKVKPASELSGDSAQYQDRDIQEKEAVKNIGVTIRERALNYVDEVSNAPLTMKDVKNILKDYSMLADMSITDMQELVELAMTNETRKVALKYIDSKDKKFGYDLIVAMYKMQPILNARDSTRFERQQYSTPTPFGYVMGQFINANKKVESVLEPSAGNGALTITFPAPIVHVNDIDERRIQNLRTLGYGEVTTRDALLPFDESVDAVVTNPPFGTTVAKEFDGGKLKISSLEGLMAINALDSMKDDGRAAIIIGGNTSYRENGAMQSKDMKLFAYLYSHYNVVDVINLDGEMYKRNGTKFNERIILINGRKTGPFKLTAPPVKSKARAEQVKTFDELYNRIQDDIRSIQQMGDLFNGTEGEARTTDNTGSGENSNVSNRPKSGERGKSVQPGKELGSSNDVGSSADATISGQGTNGKPSAENETGTVDNANGSDAGSTPVVQEQGNEQRGSESGRNTGGVREENSVSTNSGNNTGRSRLAVNLGDEKVPYPNRSQSGTLMSVVPANQAQVLADSLANIGDVDQFLVDELGYSSKEELFGYLAAEQIDSVSLAINQMNKGNGFIIGDMTGVGKGRQGAALVRYAVRKGYKPIYFTQKPALFADNYRDLSDIGSSNLRPFIIASDPKNAAITDAAGNVVHKLPSEKERKRVFDYILKNGTLPDEYDYVITTYSQINNGTKEYEATDNGITEKDKKYKKKSPSAADKSGQIRRDVIKALSKNNIMILDESHTAGGSGGGSMFMQYIMPDVKGVTFLSATFAKRADNMPLYAMKTDLAKSGVSPQEMIQAIAQGGVTLQEIMSKQLVQSGQMIRRERDFSGVTIDWMPVNEEEDAIQRKQFDEVSSIFSDIRAFQKDYITPMVTNLSDELAGEGGFSDLQKGTKELGVTNTPFASKMYNLVNQLLFSLKADAVANRVIYNLKNGFKPIISFTNTMEGFLDEAPKDTPMDKVPNFSLTLMRALDGVMRYSVDTLGGEKENKAFLVSELNDEGQKRYYEIKNKIENLSADLPISPMDAIKMKIEQEGYKVGEITGRTLEMVKDENGKYVIQNRKDKDKKTAARDFNNGKLDVLMINKSGSTGISLHASPKFEDQRQRVMVFAQFQSDINDEVQMRGRIDRTGQIYRGKYEYIMSSIPAEQRLQMMFKAKLKSLDANTTSSQKSKFNEMEVVDYLNKYGDDVTWQYMVEHPELSEKLGDPLGLLNQEDEEESDNVDSSRKEGCAAKIARYLPFLPVSEQEEVFKEITDAYNVKIQLLNDAGENDLEITTMPLRAKTISKKIWKPGTDPNSGNAFADNTYLEEVEVDVLKKPMKASEIKSTVSRMSEGEDFSTWRSKKIKEIESVYNDKIESLKNRLSESAEERSQKAKKLYIEKSKEARKNKKNEFTDEEIEKMSDVVVEDILKKADESFNKQKKVIEARKENILKQVNSFEPLRPLVIPFNLDEDMATLIPSRGMFLGFKFSKDFSPSSSTAVFATMDGRRKVEIPLKQEKAFRSINMNTMMQPTFINGVNLDNWDSYTPTQSRKKSYIITGNLLQALVDIQKNPLIRGYLVSYSTENGDTRQGILMSDSFKPGDLTMSVPISSKLIQIQQGESVISDDKRVIVEKNNGWKSGYVIKVPRSKKMGGEFFEDNKLRSLADNKEFVTRGNYMVAEISSDNLPEALDRLSKMGVNVAKKAKLEDADAGDVRLREDNTRSIVDPFINDLMKEYAGEDLSRYPFEDKRTDPNNDYNVYWGYSEPLYNGRNIDGNEEVPEVIRDIIRNDEYEIDKQNIIDTLKRYIEFNEGFDEELEYKKVLDWFQENKDKFSMSPKVNLIVDRDSIPDNLYRTSTKLFEEYPLWLSGQTTSTGQHTTQITGTVNSYKKIGEWIKNNLDLFGKNLSQIKVLDASSGLGVGTKALRDMGLNVEDVEPYPSDNREKPTYLSYNDITDKYDVIISNAVLNVIPDDWRADVLKSMADKLNLGGKLIINVRDAKEIENQKQKIELDSPSEILVTDKNGNIRAYQKGFSNEELTDWVKSQLGDGWLVQKANEKNSGLKNARAVVVTRNNDAPLRYRDISSKSQFNNNIEKEVKSASDKLNIPVEVITSPDQIKDQSVRKAIESGRKVKGWYSISEGKVYLYLPNATSMEDAVQTLLHEGVAHYGLRRLVGEERMDDFLDDIFTNASKEVRQRIIDTLPKYGYNSRIATEEYMARMAEKGVDDVSFWDRIKQAFKNLLRRIGININVNDNELRYILWRSRQNLNMERPLDMAKDVAMQYQMGVGNYYRDDTSDGSREAYENSLQGWRYKAREAYQDSMLALKNLQDVVAKVSKKPIQGFENAYIAENQLSSRNTTEARRYNEKFFKPLMDAEGKLIKKYGLTHKAIERYMMLAHGIERNVEMTFREQLNDVIKNNPDDAEQFAEDFRQEKKKLRGLYSGYQYLKELTDYIGEVGDYSATKAILQSMDNENHDSFQDDALDYVKDFENTYDVKELWDKTNKATKETLRKSYESGIMSKDHFANVSNMFMYYVPLRGWNEKTAEDVYDYINSERTPINSVLKKMKGRSTPPDEIMATIGNMAESAIVQGNRNLMKQAFMNMVMNHPTDLATLKKAWYVYDPATDEWNISFPDIEENDTPETIAQKIQDHEDIMKKLKDQGIATQKSSKLNINYKITKENAKQHVVQVKNGGKDYLIYVNANPRAAQAVNGLTNPDAEQNPIFNAISTANRWLAANFTTRNPAFVMSNLSRDIIFSMAAINIKEDGKYSARFRKNIFKAMPVIMRNLRGNDKGTESDKYFKEFIENGGETGYMHLTDVNEYKKKVRQELRKITGKQGSARAAFDYTLERLEDFNRWAEDVSRFSVYMTSRQMGRSIVESINDAKEVTVNFNKKGAGYKTGGFFGITAGAMRNLYLFFNASVQSLTNFNRLRVKNPTKFYSTLGGFMAAGFLMPVINNLFHSVFGDGDDPYNDLPEWVRRNNLCIYAGDGKFVTIPLPIELRAFYGLGDYVYQLIAGREKPTPAGISKGTISQLADLLPLNPTGNEGFRTFMPDALSPIFETYVWNEDFTGKPIAKLTPFNERDPEWKRVYKGTSAWLVDTSKFLNDLTNGDKPGKEFRKGFIDFNPAKVENLFESYFGGMAKFLNQAGKTIYYGSKSLVEGEKDDNLIMRNVPALNRFVNTVDERNAFSGINTEYFNLRDEMEQFKYELNGVKKNFRKNPEEYRQMVRSDMFQKYMKYKPYQKKLDKLYQMGKEQEGEEREQTENMITETRRELLQAVK